MKWLYRLEYKYGKYHIHNLMAVIVAGMFIVFAANMLMPQLLLSHPLASPLALNREAIFSGQVWRLFTFIFIPNGTRFLTFISMYFYYIMGSHLESGWGGFRFNAYYLCGIIGTIIAAMITGFASNSYLNLSLFLAYATLAPDSQFLLFFILPIKAKILAGAYVVIILLQIISQFVSYSPMNGIYALVAFLFSLLNYLLFFGNGLIGTIKNEIRIAKNRRNWRNR